MELGRLAKALNRGPIVIGKAVYANVRKRLTHVVEQQINVLLKLAHAAAIVHVLLTEKSVDLGSACVEKSKAVWAYKQGHIVISTRVYVSAPQRWTRALEQQIDV